MQQGGFHEVAPRLPGRLLHLVQPRRRARVYERVQPVQQQPIRVFEGLALVPVLPLRIANRRDRSCVTR